MTSVMVASILMSTCMLGPAVSLNGSPTVSPVTAALCASEFFPPCAPVSTYFLRYPTRPRGVQKQRHENPGDGGEHQHPRHRARAPNSSSALSTPPRT